MNAQKRGNFPAQKNRSYQTHTVAPEISEVPLSPLAPPMGAL